MQTTKQIVLDFGKKNQPVTIWAKQNDNATRYIEIVPLNNGEEFVFESGITAQFRVTKHDKKSVVNPATIENNIITVELTNQVLAAAGEATAEIALFKGAEVLSTQTFIINVEESAYNAEKVESADEYKALVEKLKQINELSASAEIANNAAKKVQKIANGIDEKIDNALSGIDITAEIVSAIEGYNGYAGYEDILGLQVDYENKIFKRLASLEGKSDVALVTFMRNFHMYSGRKRCLVSKDGTITAFSGDTNYNDSGSATNGQVMVYQPKFYYKVVPLKTEKNANGLGYHIRKANYYVSDNQHVGFKLHPAFYDENGNEVDYILFSAYEGCYWDSSMQTYFKDGTMNDADTDLTRDSICSLSGKKPISGAIKNLTKTNLELLAHNLGNGWHLETIKTVAANQLLMMIELGTMNAQTNKHGIVAFPSNSQFNASSLTGSTKGDLLTLYGITYANSTINEIGGVETPYTEDGKLAVSYRGMENPWGNIYKHINGINIWGDGSMLGGQPYIADDFDFNATKNNGNYHPAGFTLPNGAGYISAMGYGSEKYDWLLMPSEVQGDNSLPVGDYTETTANVNGYRTVLHGGAYYNNLAAGIFDYYCAASATIKGRNFGGRLVYIPTAK